MENASKALIIAGAILLSILIISLGIMVYNNAKNTVGSANLNQEEVATFNSKWESYAGTNKTASEVRTLISAVIANNAAEKKSGSQRLINVNKKSTSVDLSKLMESYYNTTKTYKVTLTFNNTTGLITDITVSDK